MRIVETGHQFALNNYDHDPEVANATDQTIIFVKRVGDRYPGNEQPSYSGTNCQEVLRALISRCLYLNGQIECAETTKIINHLRGALRLFEVRASRVKNIEWIMGSFERVEELSACRTCGHLSCDRHD